MTAGESGDVREPGWDDIIDRHKGASFAVLGSGPSINQVGLGFARSMITLGSNAIGYKISPLYYSIFDPVSFRNFSALFYSSPSVRVLPPWIDGACDLRIEYEIENEVGFSSQVLYHGRSSGFINIGLAARMGAREIHVIGVDGYDSPSAPYFYAAPKDYTARSLGKWTDARRELTLSAYTAAGAALRDLGIRFVNHSPVSFLTNIEHVEQARLHVAKVTAGASSFKVSYLLRASFCKGLA